MPKNLKLPRLPQNFQTAVIVLITLVAGFFGGSYYNQKQQSALPTHGIVTRIIDPDNIELDNKYSVRLYAVNCPEKGQTLSDETIAYLTKTALNQKARVEYQPNYAKDRWDRFLGYVFIDDTFLNQELIRQGFCSVTIYDKRAKLKYQDELIQAQDQAKQEKLGRWSN